VYVFQNKLYSFLSNKLKDLTKLYYFFDGASLQYKTRKNFINLCYNGDDFGMGAEWHFFTTSRSKGACDGIWGTVKRLARKASLKNPYEEQTTTIIKLYEWALVKIP
jgi:hypothetical protein